MSVRILSAAKAFPQHSRSTAEILPLVDLWLADEPERFRQKVHRLFKYAGVDRRYSILSPEEVFGGGTFAQRNRLYAERILPLAEQALTDALSQSGISPEELDVLVTTSCTGITIPALDAQLINRLRMRQDIERLPVFQMGCAGGVAGLTYAQRMLSAKPGGYAAVIAMESPTATLQKDDLSMANMVSAAIFGDGAACAILANSCAKKGLSANADCCPVIVDAGMYHFPNEEGLMGFDLVDTGLKMVLAPAVPERIQQHFKAIIHPFLEKNDLSMERVDHFLFHPGGRKILTMVQALLSGYGKNVDVSREVLRAYGNMSSATVLYVLEEFLRREIAAGDHGLVLSFGPGFSAQRVLLRWEH